MEEPRPGIFEMSSLPCRCRHRHRHLRSQTLSTLVGILDCFYEETRSYKITPQVRGSGISASIQLQSSETETQGLAGHDFTKEEARHEMVNSAIGERAREEANGTFSGSGIPELDNLSTQKDEPMVELTEVNGSQEKTVEKVHRAMEELENEIRGDDGSARGSGVDFLTNSMQKNINGNHNVVSNNQRDYLDIETFLMDTPENSQLSKNDVELNAWNTSEFDELLVDEDISSLASKPDKNKEDENISFKTTLLETELEKEQKDLYIIESENIQTQAGERYQYNAVDVVEIPVHKDTSTGISPIPDTGNNNKNTAKEDAPGDLGHETLQKDELGELNCTSSAISSSITVGREIEEGEISDGEEQILEEVPGQEEVKYMEQEFNKRDNMFSSSAMNTVDYTDDSKEVRQSSRIDMELEPAIAASKYSREDEEVDGNLSLSKYQRSNSQNGGATEVLNYSKSCLGEILLSGQASEKNTTGNLEIISNKFDAGICTEKKKKRSKGSRENKKRKERLKRAAKNRELGVKRLKLLPVSKPKIIKDCTHFLKGRCRKGEKCPFSHDAVPLTKSTPCRHFARNSCMKGDDCPFDHQLSKYPCDNFVSKGYCSRGGNCLFSHEVPGTASDVCKPDEHSSQMPGLHKKTGRKVPEIMIKPPEKIPKGVDILSYRKSPLDSSGKHEQTSPCPGDIVKIDNHTNRNANKLQNAGEIPVITPPAVAPKGMSFLTVGKSPIYYSSGRRDDGIIPSKGDINVNVSQTHNSSTFKQDDSSLKKVSGTRHLAAPGSTLLPLKKAPAPCSEQARKNSSEEVQNSSDLQWRLPLCPSPTDKPSCRSSGGPKSIPGSSQRALLSTLAFAAKYESKLKLDRPVGISEGSINGEVNGSSNSNSLRASAILDFIFDGGSKTKQ